MRVTIKDIASKVGVTAATVSMVINNNKKISEATRDKVLKAIQEMNYHPNYIGRSLVMGKTENICLVATSFASVFSLELVKGVEQRLCDTKYNLSLYSTRGSAENEREILKKIFYERRVDGVLSMTATFDKRLIEEFKNQEMPVVLVEQVTEGAPCVKVDNVKGGYLATDYLIKKGRKDIVIVLGQKGAANADERQAGYEKALGDNGMQVNEDNIIRLIHYSFEEGKEIMKKIVNDGRKVDAIFSAAGDVCAMGILAEAKAHNIRIPEDMSLIGFDDLYMATLTTPALTTIKQPIEEMGMQALDMLLNIIEKKSGDTSRVISFEPTLIIRDSA
jgi:LacI family transcriptional regulator